jgi:hypothetical protein
VIGLRTSASRGLGCRKNKPTTVPKCDPRGGVTHLNALVSLLLNCRFTLLQITFMQTHCGVWVSVAAPSKHPSDP